MSDERPPFDPVIAVDALLDEGVRFVVVGGVAAGMHGAPLVTRDLDVCYARDRKNVEALVRALHELHARLRGTQDDVPFLLDADTILRGANFTFTTDAGDLDILAVPSGSGGYDALLVNAKPEDLGPGRVLLIAGLDDLIEMKRAAGRGKDLNAVEVLSALRDHIDGRP